MIALLTITLLAGIAIWVNNLHPPAGLTPHNYTEKLKQHRNILVFLIYMLPLLMFIFFNSLLGITSFYELMLSVQIFAVPALALIAMYAIIYIKQYTSTYDLSLLGFVERAHSQTSIIIQDVVNQLAKKAGVPIPEVKVVLPVIQGNIGFMAASVQHSGSQKGAIIIGEDFIYSIPAKELYATLAHEVSHLHTDTRGHLLTLKSIMEIMPLLLCASYLFLLIMNNLTQLPLNEIGVIIFNTFLTYFIFKVMFQFMYFAISRKEEYLADAGAVHLTGKEPLSMFMSRLCDTEIKVLDTLSKEQKKVYLWKKHARAIWTEHPPSEQRLKAINGMNYPDSVYLE